MTRSPAGPTRVVLHVVESWGAGVRAATLQFVHATPEVEHHLLRATGRAEFASDGETVFQSVRTLPTNLPGAHRAIRAAVRELRPDVVHAHSTYAGAFVRTAVRSTARRRIVYSPHCFAFERGDLPRLRRRLTRVVERVLAHNTDTLAACSPGEARTAAGMHVRRIVTVPNVARVPALAMLERRHPSRVVGVGRIGAQKDPAFFREAVGLLGAMRPQVSAWWIGDGDDHASRYALERDGVHVTGWLPSFDAQRALGGAGVYLHTARWEGFPLSILEAVELGIPVIARDVPTMHGAIATPGVRTPAEMAAAADALIAGGDDARQKNLDAWRALLVDNTEHRQAVALRAAYRGGTGARVLVNGKFLGASSPSGMQRYATEVTRRLVDADPAARVVVPRDAVLPTWLPDARVLRSRLRGIAFEQLALPWRARRAMLLNLAGPAPLVTRDQLVVMHDVTPERFPGTFSRRFVLWYRVMYRVLARRARHLATVSEFSRGELAEVLGVDAGRFAIAPNGHEHALAVRAEADEVRFGGAIVRATAEPYVLFIGNLTPSKNLAPTARAFARAGVPVVVVGAAGARRVFVAESGLDVSGVHLAGRLTDAELARLLRGARALVFPSLYEGFGLPIVEAQALGCPIIASDRASIPEVAGDGAVLYDPTRPDDAVALLGQLDPAAREALVRRGHANVTRFTWDRTAATLLAMATDAAVPAPAPMADELDARTLAEWPPPTGAPASEPRGSEPRGSEPRGSEPRGPEAGS